RSGGLRLPFPLLSHLPRLFKPGRSVENLALAAQRTHNLRMAAKVGASSCVVCAAGGRKSSSGPAKMSRVIVRGRALTLCREHAGAVAIRMPKTWEDLRQIFAAGSDRRSPLPRRAAESDDRRVFPPRPEGRRKTTGRRTTDPRD